ncbi:M23 family metallopeptidase [Neiella sp. HB171785]|uniref:M23 family metallopeptidase n=1 Tax=Neiella litorisoli TaxID=2771431 RepID=A0A8J6UJE6_9GAMM|nr:M23 family metallopeptidase [Neiella litorisoli]
MLRWSLAPENLSESLIFWLISSLFWLGVRLNLALNQGIVTTLYLLFAVELLVKQRLLITVTSYQGARHYSVHKLLLWASLLTLLVVIGGVYLYQQQVRTLEQQLLVSQREVAQAESSIAALQQSGRNMFSSFDQQYDQLRHYEYRLIELETLAGTAAAGATPMPDSIDDRLLSAQHQLLLRQQMLSKIPNGQPMQYRRISSRFGTRNHPISKKRHSHVGIDLRADKGIPVYATADGYVQQARSNYDRGYGNMVKLSHQMGFDTRYAHLDSVAVKYGQFVRKGELVGYCGNSGDSTASHLHYEVRFLGKALDPKPFMTWQLDNYEDIFDTVGTLPWDSFQDELRLQLQPQVLQLSHRAPSSMVPLSSVATFISTEK